AVVDRLNRIYPRGLVSCNIKDTGLTAILCRRNDDVFEVSKFLKENAVAHQLRLSAVLAGKNRERNIGGKSNTRLGTIHSAKGHEFNNVILFNWFPDGEAEETRVYYTALARASKQIFEVPNLPTLLTVLGKINNT
ncbi:MAG: ATP-binding domain-containing protein, partial [Gammaproteobacteria bacterium]|nr:ATP-binding domain-containing protein [Gammaproteobacteria bacterium]